MATLAIDVLPRDSSPGRRAFSRLLHRPSAVLGLVVVVAFVGVALAAPLLAPYDPIATSWSAIRKAPSSAHLFGTDELGRDVFSRVIFGARTSLLAGVVSVLISLSLGIPIGLLAGYVGRWTDGVISRVTDAMLATPFLILAIALAAFLGPSLTNAMIAIGITATPIFIRLTRAQVLSAKSEDYVEAARALGNPHWRIALRHIFPNIVAPLIVQATLAIAAATVMLDWIRIGGSMFGRMWRTAIRRREHPSARAASMNSSVLMTSTVPRERRRKIGSAAIPIAIIALTRLGPRNAASAIATIRNGMASIASVIRMMSPSIQPPA